MRRVLFSIVCLIISLSIHAAPTRSALGAYSGYEEDVKGPYDSEVQYIESTGTQYIDTGLNSSIHRFCDFRITYRHTTDARRPPYGYQYGATARYGMWRSTSGIISAGINSSTCISFIDDEEWHTIEVVNGNYIIFDDEKFTIGTGTVRANIGCLLFAYITSSSSATEFYKTSARISECKIYNINGEILRDYIPVRKDGAGYMYDRVSGELFGNSGTGEFIVGPDNE